MTSEVIDVPQTSILCLPDSFEGATSLASEDIHQGDNRRTDNRSVLRIRFTPRSRKSGFGVNWNAVDDDCRQVHASQRSVENRFGRIAYIDRGNGDAVLFLHGFPLNSFPWRGAIDHLSSDRRCLAPDFLGLGYTDVTEGHDFEGIYLWRADRNRRSARFFKSRSTFQEDIK